MLQKCLQFSKHHDMNEYCTMFGHFSVWGFYKIKKGRNLFDWLNHQIEHASMFALLFKQTHWPLLHYGLQLLYWFNLLSKHFWIHNPRLIQIHLVRMSTSATFEKNPQMRIYSLSANIGTKCIIGKIRTSWINSH